MRYIDTNNKVYEEFITFFLFIKFERGKKRIGKLDEEKQANEGYKI